MKKKARRSIMGEGSSVSNAYCRVRDTKKLSLNS